MLVGSPLGGHLAASLPDGFRAWSFEVWWIPETFLPCRSLDGVPGPSPQRHWGKWPAPGRPAHDWHTLTRLWFVLFPSLPPPEYKKKYGEEHGSCQAGIAGFFTEVGVSRPLRVFVSFLDLISVVRILVF